MRLIILLLLFTIPTCAQKSIIIKDNYNASISGASVFLVMDKNNLVAVSDENGAVSLDLKENQKYLLAKN